MGLSKKDKAKILRDFKEWSGGFAPGECCIYQKIVFCDYALSVEYDKKLVITWLNAL